jgi:hypothetical protein
VKLPAWSDEFEPMKPLHNPDFPSIFPQKRGRRSLFSYFFPFFPPIFSLFSTLFIFVKSLRNEEGGKKSKWRGEKILLRGKKYPQKLKIGFKKHSSAVNHNSHPSLEGLQTMVEAFCVDEVKHFHEKIGGKKGKK